MPDSDARLFEPNQWTNILGVTYAKHEHAAVLTIGNRTWDRWHLGRLGCPHPVAAAMLNRVVKALGITTLKGLAAHIRVIGNYKGVGTTCYALALAVLKEAGFDLNRVHSEDRTFVTIKAKARQLAAKQAHRKRRPRRAGPPSEMRDATV